MAWNETENEDNTIYKVVINHEGQYSIWPDYKDLPLGWQSPGKTGTKADCLAYIKEVWTDMRPLSLREKMDEAKTLPSPSRGIDTNRSREKSLVERLCEGDQPVEVILRPERTVSLLREAIERAYVHVKFTGTAGGTELGLRLDSEKTAFGSAHSDDEQGTVHIEGNLMLDYVKVRCIANFDLSSMAGRGHLVKLESEENATYENVQCAAMQ